MNLLPLVIGFILIFSYFSASFLQEARLVAVTDRSLKSAERLGSMLHNARVRRQYTQIAQAPSQNNKSSSQRKLRYFSRRTLQPSIEYAKLNLMPLMDPQLVDPQKHPLYPIALGLIHFLYARSPSIVSNEKAGWEQQLLDALIHKGREHPSPHLADLTPNNPRLQKIYYKMLRGTQYYDLSLLRGIPPLTEFVTLEEDKKENSIYFCFASPPLLIAIFGEKMAQKILSHEQTQWEINHHYHLTSKQEFEAFLMQDPAIAQRFNTLQPYLNFQQKLPKKTALKAQDQKTGLTLVQPLP